MEKNEEKKYIYKSIEKLFTKEELFLHNKTTEAILKCQKYFRDKYDPSIVSLRDISIFVKFVEFFKIYFIIKNKYENRNNNEKNNKIRSIICSIYLCYYFRLKDEMVRSNFDIVFRNILL